METHNAHMLIPKPLWLRSQKRSIVEGKNMTELVVDALIYYLENAPVDSKIAHRAKGER